MIHLLFADEAYEFGRVVGKVFIAVFVVAVIWAIVKKNKK